MTAPFSSDLVASLTAATAWRFKASLGNTFSPRFFCCSDPNDLGIVDGKEPVAVISGGGYTVAGGSITFDGTNSYDPDGSIVGYSWSFGGGSPSSSTSSSQGVTFSTAGSYEVTLTVEDGTGLRSIPAAVDVTVVAADSIFEDDGSEYVPGGVYAGTSTGVYFSSDSGQTWTALNTGLSGDALTVNDFRQSPESYGMPQANHVLWIATDDGPYLSTNGGGAWTQKLPAAVSNAWSDSPAPAVGDLTFHAVQFAGTKLFTIARWTNGSGEERSWIFYTEDAGETWTEVTE